MGVCTGLDSSVCAAWVQAWGSIGAIVATGIGVYLAHHLQEHRDRQRQKDERVGRLEVLFQLVDSTVNGVSYIQRQLSDKSRIQAARLGRPNIDPDAVRSLGDLLEPIPLHSLDDPVVAFEILVLTKNALQLRELANMAIRHVEGMSNSEIAAAIHSMDMVRKGAEQGRAKVRNRIDLIKSTPA